MIKTAEIPGYGHIHYREDLTGDVLIEKKGGGSVTIPLGALCDVVRLIHEDQVSREVDTYGVRIEVGAGKEREDGEVQLVTIWRSLGGRYELPRKMSASELMSVLRKIPGGFIRSLSPDMIVDYLSWEVPGEAQACGPCDVASEGTPPDPG